MRFLIKPGFYLSLLLISAAISCKKDTISPDPNESPYYIKATINGVPTTYNAYATAYLGDLSNEVWYLRGFTGNPDTSAHNFTREVQKGLSDYMQLLVGFPNGYPTLGIYPSNGWSTQNWSDLHIYKYVNTFLEPTFTDYRCVPTWDSTSSIIQVTLVNDSLIQGTFSGMVWRIDDSTFHYKVENGSFYLHTSK